MREGQSGKGRARRELAALSVFFNLFLMLFSALFLTQAHTNTQSHVQIRADWQSAFHVVIVVVARALFQLVWFVVVVAVALLLRVFIICALCIVLCALSSFFFLLCPLWPRWPLSAFCLRTCVLYLLCCCAR